MSALSDLRDSAFSTVEGLQSDLDMARAPRQKQVWLDIRGQGTMKSIIEATPKHTQRFNML